MAGAAPVIQTPPTMALIVSAITDSSAIGITVNPVIAHVEIALGQQKINAQHAQT